MKPSLLVSLALAALCAVPGRASAADCPGREALAPLLKTDGIFLGELHGSAEVPALVECLARRLADELLDGRPLWVALELQPAALEESGTSWQPRLQDGRTSQAMLKLVRVLRSLQAQGRLTVTGFVPTAEPIGAADYEQALARELDRAPADAFVLALAGNVHARKSKGTARFSLQAVAPAGSLLQRRMTHVLIDHRQDSQAWVCMPGCGPHSLSSDPQTRNRPLGLQPLDDDDYDYLLLLDRLSASPPAHPQQAVGASAPAAPGPSP